MTLESEGLLSGAALEPFLALADGDHRLARAFRELDLEVGQAFQPALRGLTHALASRMHAALSEDHGEGWLVEDRLTLMPWQRRTALGTTRALARGREPAEPPGVALALPLGFWISMLAPECRRLWDASLHRIMQAEDGSGPGREETARTLHRIDDLRQRSRRQARPVIHLELDAIHDDIARLTRRLSPALAGLYGPLYRFPDARFDELLSLVPRRPGGVVN